MKFWSLKNPLILLAVVSAFVAVVFLIMVALAWVFEEDADARLPERSTYATCYNLRGHTANGFSLTYNTRAARRTAASNVLHLGTRIRLTGRHAGPTGVRRYVVRDTGGALGDGHLDLWSASCSGWPNPPVRYRIGWKRHG